MRLCSRNRPTMLVTVMFSLMPRIPGRRQQMPRTSRLDFHSRAGDASYKQADDMRIHQSVHLEDQLSMAAIALMLDLAQDQRLKTLAHCDRRDQEFLKSCLAEYPVK